MTEELFSDYKPSGENTGDDLFSDYGSVKDQKEKSLKFLVDETIDETPERTARALEIQKRTGIPKKFIDENFDELDRTARQSEFDPKKFTKSNPKISEWLSRNPDYAPLIREDEGVGALEGIFRVAENTIRSVGAAPSRAGSGLYGVAQAGADVLGADTLAGFFSEQRQSAAGIASNIRGPMKDVGPLERAAYSGIESATQTALMIPAAILSGSPAPLLITTSLQTGGESYGQARDKGRDVATSLGYGTSQAVIEYATELLPASKLLKDLIGDSGFVKTITNQLVTEIPGEQIATILQDLNEWAVLNPEQPFSSYLEERPSAAAQTLVATIVGTSAQTTVAYGGKKLVDHVEKRSVEKQAKVQEDFFTALGENATNSKLRERLPDSYQEIIGELTKDGPVENVYTPVEFFQSHFQEQGIDPRQLATELGIERQYDEAVNTGGKIAIPTAVYAKNLAPTEHNALFAKELSFSPDQMSSRETEEFLKESEKEPEVDTFGESLTQAMTPIREQLKAIYPADVADRNAAVIEARLRSRASRLGIAPQELMKQRPLDITEGGTESGSVLNQNEAAIVDWSDLDERYSKALKGNRRERQRVVNEASGVVPIDSDIERDGAHSPSSASSGAPAWDLSGNGIYPEDVYGPDGFRYYSAGDERLDRQAYSIVMGLEGTPNAGVKIYRAVEENGQSKILPGDWVTTVRAYAKDHGEGALNGKYKIISKTVTAKDIYTSGDSWLEWGYNPQPNTYPRSMHMKDGRARLPSERFRKLESRDPNDPNILYQAEPQWFSALAKGLESAKQSKATAKDWKAIIPKLAGVKADEIEATGLTEWLDMQTGQVTKEAVLEFVRQNGVQVKEVTLGEQAIMDEMDARNFGATSTAAAGSTKFASYQLPGGENYRELLLTLPADLASIFEVRQKGSGHGVWNTKTEDWATTTLNKDVAEDGARKLNLENTKGTFKSGHFDESNILAHVRFNERTDADGKRVLFIEEVQSDWAQKGRKEGFNANLLPEGYSIIEDSIEGEDTIFFVLDEKGNHVDTNGGETKDAAVQSALNALNRGTVPSAPFVTDTKAWSMLAMKRMIRYSVENGFDKIAWTTGEQQAARYDLSKQVREIKADPHGNGKYTLELTMPDGGTKTMRNLAEPDLEENIGKDLAKKIIEDSAAFSKAYAKYHDAVVAPGTPEAEMDRLSDLRDEAEQKLTYSGLDLKVGGEGMKAFYDQMLPQMVNKYVKKWGGKVSETDFDLGDPEDAKTLPSDDMIDEGGFTAHALDITPAMRDAVMQGQPLFQGKDIARGSISITPTGDIIRLFQSRNLSTLLHEFGHRWLFELQDDATLENAPQQIKDDLTASLEWLGLKTVDELDITKHAAGTEGHAKAVAANEKWAQGIEAYMKEGKAPSTALRRVFASIRAWMVAVYDALKQGRLEADLSPEIRGVFDRLLATDQEIAAAKETTQPVFTTAVDAGMTDTQFAAYRQTIADANREAQEDIDAKIMLQYKRTLTELWKEDKAKVQAEVEAELDVEPAYAAMAKMQENGIKIDRAEAKGLRNLASKDGIPADMAAEMLGFTSGEALVKALLSVENRKSRVARETDLRMNQRFGDMMTDGTIVEEARQALASDTRAKVIEAEIKALNKKAREVKPFLKAKEKADKEEARAGRDIYKAMVPKLGDVRGHAASVIAAKPIRELKPMQYYNTTRQASRAAVEAVRKKDYLMAAYHKGRELLNMELYRSALKAQEDIEAGNEKLQKVFVSDIKQSKTRNMDMVNAARAILASHGLGKTDESPSSYLEKMRQYDPEVYENLRPIFEPAIASMKNYRDMTVEEYIGMRDAVFALMKTSRRSKQIEVDGKLIERDEVVANLVNRMMDFDKGEKTADLKSTLDDLQKTKIGLLSAKAALRRVESWVTAMDGGSDGVFRKFMWNPVIDAVNNYREEKRKVISKYAEIVKDVAPGITKAYIEAPELGFKFRGKSELLHALLHTGNDSNKSKLLIGYGWGERTEDGSLDSRKWAAFEKRMRDEGVLTKVDYDFAQNVWDMMEEMKPSLQEAHHRMYGYYFNEVTANEFSNEFGTYKGGYVPAKVDVNVVMEAEQRKDAEEITQGQNSFAFPTTGRGATMSRVDNYARPLQLDMRSIPAHIDWAMRFAHLEPTVKDVARVILDKDFAKSLNGLDPTTINHMLVPWLQRTAQQLTSTRGMNKFMDKFWTGVRGRTGMQIMVTNAINTLQQFTGLTIALTRVKASSLRSAMWMYITDHKKMSEVIDEKSLFMRNRVFTSQNEVLKTVDDILLNPTKYESAKDFANKHGYFMQQATQGFVDQIVWNAAYNESLAEGKTDKDAVRHADSTVRETQGSFSPEDISRFEAGTPFVRAFSMFYNYFNMQANLLLTEFSKIASNELGLRKGSGRSLYVYTVAFMIPAFVGDQIIRALVAGRPDEDDEGYQDDLIKMFFGSQFGALFAMVPVAGPIANSVVNAWNDKWYDDKITTSPAISMIEGAGKTSVALYKSIMDEGYTLNQKRAVKDTLNLIGLMTGLPAGALGRPLGYLADVNQGKANPENALDVTRGLISGQDVNRTR